MINTFQCRDPFFFIKYTHLSSLIFFFPLRGEAGAFAHKPHKLHMIGKDRGISFLFRKDIFISILSTNQLPLSLEGKRQNYQIMSSIYKTSCTLTSLPGKLLHSPCVTPHKYS